MRKEVFLWKLLSCFCLFRTLSKRFLTICREFLAGLLKLHSECRCHKFREKLFVYERSILAVAVSDIERIRFGPLLKNIFRDCDNCLQCVHRNIFTKDNFFEKKGMIFFSDLEFNIVPFCRKNVGEVVKIAFFVPYEHIFQKFFEKKKVIFYFSFWDHERQFFGIPSKILFAKMGKLLSLCT